LEVAQLRNKIVLDLLSKGKISIGEKIDYSKFLQLYSEYNYLPNHYFAKILGCSYDALVGMKHGNKAIVLKDFDYSLIKVEILNYLLDNKIIEQNSKIMYSKLEEIFGIFPFLDEHFLAEILRIKHHRIQNIKYNQESSATILKTEFSLTEEEITIRNKLVSDGFVIPGMQLTKEVFDKLHKLYPHMTDYRLGYILEIKTSAFSNFKRGVIKPFILKSLEVDFIESQKLDIIEDLINNRHAYIEEKINYERFLELYSGYEYINIYKFAQIILGINYSNCRSLKTKNSHAIIFKDVIKLDDEKCNQIFELILKQFNLQEGDIINYEQFLFMYKSFKNFLTEDKFAEILGINKSRYYALKYNNVNARIINGVTLEKMYFIKPLFKEPRYYTKEEIDKIINTYGITLEEFIIHIINNRIYFKTEHYIEALLTNGKLFIGKTKMEEIFFNENYSQIKRTAKFAVHRLFQKNLLVKEADDVIQDLLIYIYNNCGDLQYNFDNQDVFYNKLLSRIKKYITGNLIDYLKTTKKIPYLEDKMNKMPEDKNRIIIDKNTNIEEEVIESLSTTEDELYDNVLRLIENGYSLEECINYLSEKTNINSNDLYSHIKEKCLSRMESKKA